MKCVKISPKSATVSLSLDDLKRLSSALGCTVADAEVYDKDFHRIKGSPEYRKALRLMNHIDDVLIGVVNCSLSTKGRK